MRKEFRKREALVSSESPGQSRCACEKSKGGKDETRDQCTDHGRCGSFGPCCSEKYMDYRISGGTFQSKCYIADPEQDRDRKGHGHDATEYECYDHASRYNDRRVCHFFTCQRAISRQVINRTILSRMSAYSYGLYHQFLNMLAPERIVGLMCCRYSPTKHHAVDSKPMHQETPLLFHPPEFSKSAKTNLALLRGER